MDELNETAFSYRKHRLAKTIGLILGVIAFNHLFIYYFLRLGIFGLHPYLPIDCSAPIRISFIKAVVIAPILEEVVFRMLPVVLLLPLYFGNRVRQMIFWTVIIAVSCVMFGLIHGHWSDIITVGIGGLAYAWLVLNVIMVNCVRFTENGKKYLKVTGTSLAIAYMSAITVHATYNATCFLVYFLVC